MKDVAHIREYSISRADIADVLQYNATHPTHPLRVPPEPGTYRPVPGTGRNVYYNVDNPSITTGRRAVQNAERSQNFKAGTSREREIAERQPVAALRGRGRNRTQAFIDTVQKFLHPHRPKPRAVRAPIAEHPQQAIPPPEGTPVGPTGIPTRPEVTGEWSDRGGSAFVTMAPDASRDDYLAALETAYDNGMNTFRVIYLDENGTHQSTEWTQFDGYEMDGYADGIADGAESYNGEYVPPASYVYIVFAPF